MELEDDKEKARRNLMVISVAVVLAWWLDLSAHKMAQRQLGLETTVAAWALWAALLLGFVYLLARYKFLYYEKLASGLSDEAYSRCYRATHDFLSKQVGTADGSPVFGNLLRIVIEEHRNALAKTGADAARAIPRCSLVAVSIAQPTQANRQWWAGDVDVEIRWLGPLIENSNHAKIAYSLPLPVRHRIRVWSCLRSWIYSASGIEYLVPLLTAAVAIAIALWNVISLYALI